MKNPSFRRKDGFTLVELLVVIAIIAVLAGAGFAAGNAAVQKAKKTTALATVVSLESAVNNFYTEYGSMPVTGDSETEYKTDKGANGIPVLTTLLGIETGTSLLNPRMVKFLSVREGKNNKNGIILNTTGTTVTGLFDPWGGPYKMMLDVNYDEKLTFTPTGGKAVNLNGRRVAAWSEGADYKDANLPGDDVISWNK